MAWKAPCRFVRRLPGVLELALHLYWKPASHVAGSIVACCHFAKRPYKCTQSSGVSPSGMLPLFPSGSCVVLKYNAGQMSFWSYPL